MAIQVRFASACEYDEALSDELGKVQVFDPDDGAQCCCDWAAAYAGGALDPADRPCEMLSSCPRDSMTCHDPVQTSVFDSDSPSQYIIEQGLASSIYIKCISFSLTEDLCADYH